MTESLPRARIIRRRVVFDIARARGRRFNDRYLTLNFLPARTLPDAAPGQDVGTVAFLTPKRLGPATVRNKLRRRMREIYRRQLARPGETGFLIWIARPPAVDLAFPELAAAMSRLVRRCNEAAAS